MVFLSVCFCVCVFVSAEQIKFCSTGGKTFFILFVVCHSYLLIGCLSSSWKPTASDVVPGIGGVWVEVVHELLMKY